MKLIQPPPQALSERSTVIVAPMWLHQGMKATRGEWAVGENGGRDTGASVNRRRTETREVLSSRGDLCLVDFI